MPSICELKIALKTKGIKGITGLNKSGLERLLSGGKTEAKKEVKKQAKKEEPKPKPFTPAPTKGESPKVAEKPINKKINLPKPPKLLMLTNKPIKEKKEPKPKKQTKQMKFYELHKAKMDAYMKSPKKALNLKLLKIEELAKRGGTEAERKQAQMQYDILFNTLLMMKD
jgi:hypothetical protein